MNYLDEVISAQKRGQARGIVSICSAHPAVLEATMLHTLERGAPLLVESTCNQVNQYGGYTGMKPLDFGGYLHQMAARLEFPGELLIQGGDHLGPEVWQSEPADVAMTKARVLVRDYVMAGYTKIHLDASMKLGGDLEGPLPVEIAAARSAELAKVAEDSLSLKEMGGGEGDLRYVIGTEVPIPGGARGEEDHLHVTAVPDLAETIEKSRAAFLSRGLESAWERVIAVVVQPGVEFGDSAIHEYDRIAAMALARFIEDQPLVYEAHSTDYQPPEALRQMVADQFAILKVGPALTFAYREAIFSLAMMENEMFPVAERSNLIDVLEEVMLANPAHWRRHYHGDPRAQQLARKFSFSDRSRYYWSEQHVQLALKKLFNNLSKTPLPLELVSQFLPKQWELIARGELENHPLSFVKDKICAVITGYDYATQP